MGAVGLDPALQRRRARHRGQGRAHRRRARPRRRPRQPRPARAQGPVRLAGANVGRPADPPARPRDGDGSSRRTGTRRWSASSTGRGSCSPTPAAGARFGFYTSGQLFLEEYYTLAVIGKAGIGTPHMDGNTRLCTATAAAALKESFGTDGQPGSYTDVDHCDAIALWGHNMAETQTVLWMRMLDRRRGADPPRDAGRRPAPDRRSPARPTCTSRPAPGTNLALMNGLLRELIAHGWFDREYVDAHTRRLRRAAARRRARTRRSAPREICDVAARRHPRAPPSSSARAERLLSTVLQGFYQSHQATAAACQVNNLHLLRGMLGRPGAGSADERPADRAEHPRDRRRRRPARLPQLGQPRARRRAGRLWNVDRDSIPHWAPPTHAMQIFRYAEQGSIELLWISATNPAVSLPELGRIRRSCAQDELFVVVQDLFLTETARARRRRAARRDLGREDRHLHQRRPHRPPVRAGGRAARRGPRRPGHLPRLRPPHGLPRPRRRAADHLARRPRRRSRRGRSARAGRPCDYTGLSYDKLRGRQRHPVAVHRRGARRHASGSTPTARSPPTPTSARPTATTSPTGAPRPSRSTGRWRPDGRAFLEAADYAAAARGARATSTRSTSPPAARVYHFHTRTKTGRAPQLDAAAPDAWVELAPADAERARHRRGRPRRGRVARAARSRRRARIAGIRAGRRLRAVPLRLLGHRTPPDHDGAPRTS